MNELPLLYIADADESVRQLGQEVLSTDFTVRCFTDAMSCVAMLSEKPPAILLIGAHIGDFNAIDLCRDIRNEDQLGDTHILVILPAEASAETIEAAHQAGCDQVLTLPVDMPNLRRQLVTTHRLSSERSSLKQQANYAQQVAMTAMTSMGELGVVLQFLSKCFNCKTPQEVAAEVIRGLNQYGLAGAVQIRSQTDSFVQSTAGGHPQADAAVLDKLHGVGRIFEFKTRMVINYEHASILMNDVPDDSEQRGRIRDNVAMLCEGAHARIASLLIEQDNRRKQTGIRYALSEILEMTTELRDQQMQRQSQGQQAVSAVISSFESSFIRFGLTPDQESELISLLVELRQEVSGITSGASDVDTKLQRVVRSLQSIAEESF